MITLATRTPRGWALPTHTPAGVPTPSQPGHHGPKWPAGGLREMSLARESPDVSSPGPGGQGHMRAWTRVPKEGHTQ